MPVNATLPTSIVLCTLNAKFIHASLGLRYLLANMARHGSPAIANQTQLIEFTLSLQISDMLEQLLNQLGPEQVGQPQIIGFGVYIWNVTPTTELVRELKARRPAIQVVLGGPEVSHEAQSQEIVKLANYVISGWGDVSFPKLCRALIEGPRPLQKMIVGEQPPLDQIELPYQHFTDSDLAHRVLYVEASRGCPFKCEFCLSSLDKTAWGFDLALFLQELSILYQRGARNFKFVDRTFNLKIETSVQILQFFLDRLTEGSGAELFVHFEVIPDNLPDRLKSLITEFPPGVLQFEVGIQSFNAEVQQRISRRQDNVQTELNLRWLLSASHAHLHTDLIFGLPGETMESFSQGFDRLLSIGPQEIQLGILKRLRGTPIARHTLTHAMVYDPNPPYAIQQTQDIDARSIQRFTRMAKYWDLVANSGRFKKTMPLILETYSPKFSAFWSFMGLSDSMWSAFGKTYGLSPEDLADAIFEHLTQERGLPSEHIRALVLEDYVASGSRARPRCLSHASLRLGSGRDGLGAKEVFKAKRRSLRERQDRHGDTPTKR